MVHRTRYITPDSAKVPMCSRCVQQRSKGRGWESCYVKKFYGMFGVEMRAYNYTSVVRNIILVTVLTRLRRA